MIKQERISKNRLVKILMSLNTTMPVSMLAEVNVDMNKTNNPYYGNVTKLVKVNAFINGSFQALPKNKAKNASGVAVPGTPLLLDRGSYYLESRILGYDKDMNTYFHNNRVINPAVVTPHLKNKKMPTDVFLQHNICMHQFKIDHIKEITLNGTNYIVK